MKKEYQITIDGKKALEKELEELKSRRGDIAQKIAEARDYGDLSENAEYDAARDEQGVVETRIAEIEAIIQNAKIITSSKSGVVGLGSQVELEFNGKKVVYTVVGPVEANPLEGRISNESPIGVAVTGKAVGDTFEIKTPKGLVTYKVSSVQ